ncbi:MAG: DNA-binding transcriptional regulator, LacI/PurR family [Friedmanniella sp.]|jgi:LacI family repressor for deo operon, udp, cdd, tsx, nupC, and nupG|nr:DNA-binding transcriptional regulator, LacI/PurR family [Friedmanniella sp.]
MAEVAERAGVSVSTVSRALRGSPLVSPETTARVLAAAQELSFAVSRAASGLATGRLNRIAVLVGGPVASWFNGSILDAIYDALHAADYELSIFRIRDQAERDEFFTALPARRNADALIVASFALTPGERDRLGELGMPLVYLNQRVDDAPSVSIDDVAAVRTGTRHLLNLGHRRLAFVQAQNATGFVYSAQDRFDGFRAELAAAGLDQEPPLVITAPSLTGGQDVVSAILASDRPPTALVTDSDELAFSVLGAMARVGLRAPEDLSVLGFDGHAMADRFELSTLAQPVEYLGTLAATIALTLAGGGTPDRPVVLAPTRLVLRRTTGRVPDPASRPAS